MSHIGYRQVQVPSDLDDRRKLVHRYLGSPVLVEDKSSRAYLWSGKIHVPKGMRTKFQHYFLKTGSDESRAHRLSDLVTLFVGISFDPQSHLDSIVDADETVEAE